jgi:hypothetical protein
MSGTFSDYLAGQAAGFTQAVGDLSRHAIADIGDSYQEILMQDASISPPEGLQASPETAPPDMTPGPDAPEAAPAAPAPETGSPDMG